MRGTLSILRFGLVQAAIGAVTVLPISTLPRLMVEEFAFAALAPGAMIGLFYAVQTSRLHVGHLSDRAGRRRPFVLGGLALAALSGALAAAAIALMATRPAAGLAVAALGYAGLGAGVGAAGTALFASLAASVSPAQRAPAATLVFLTMVAGLVVTAKAVGAALDPFGPARLVVVALAVGAAALALATLASRGLEPLEPRDVRARPAPRLALAVRELWADPAVRAFSIFMLASMFAYNMQELVLEPFGAAVFGLTPGQSTRLSGDHHAGVLLGLVLAAVAGRALAGRTGGLVAMALAGCLSSSAALCALAFGALSPGWPLGPNVIGLGVANGLFAGAAVATMFSLAVRGSGRREGTRVGLFSAAQAVGFGAGMFAGAGLMDLARALAPDANAFAVVFLVQALAFAGSAGLALRLALSAASAGASTTRGSPAPTSS